MSSELFSIIKRPIITEKNTLRATSLNEYGFEVDLNANRKQVKEAVEKLFGVKVIRVNTMIGRKESKKMGRVGGQRRLWKKAIVKLKEGNKLEFVAT